MRSFVVCIVLAGSALVSASWGPHAAPGVPQDTPEVAAAKAAHLAALARANSGGNYAGAWNGNDDGQWRDDTHQWNGNQWNSWQHEDDGQWRDDTHQYNNPASWGEDDGSYRGDNSGAWNGDSGATWGGQGVWTGHGAGAWNPGTLINGETPEVAAARAAHAAAHAAAAGHGRWRRSLVAVNPNALPVPLDTATVAIAKNAQLVQQATEGARNVLGGGIPLALPADTHEVAIGKQAHAIAHASQRALTSHGIIAPGLAVAAPAVAVAAPTVAVAAPAVALTRVVPAAALRYDAQLVAPSVIGARPIPYAIHGLHL
ncbi:Hypothetical protein NTJ_09742 [Nesidiocoris tenuis]|uniref:Pupal cuticle protein n=1 Tax=Nesidiocoris tenuis TaxID=355587 RepID=A0ABN7AXN6_9HEMI|nr:Hypothetical protein NTJ_09742 [Nesidiocoris tenuis]